MASTSGLRRRTSSDSDSEIEEKKKKYNIGRRSVNPQKFRKEWKSNPQFSAWLQEVTGKPSKAMCSICDTEFTSDLTVIKNHSKGEKHCKKASGLRKNQPTVSQMFQKTTQEDEQVRKAELGIAAFIAEHNLPMRINEHLVPLCKAAFPDSKTAQKISMGRTKATKVITNVLGKCQKQKIVENLQNRKFSLLIDESTDISTIKNICVCVRYFDDNCGKICSHFFTLIQCFRDNAEEANSGMTAETIYNKGINALKSENIPLDNLIGFGSDGCNTMFGSQNSVVSRLLINFPGIIVQKCVCHSLHLCASEACKVLPRQCEDLAREVYNFFKNSAKRQAQFVEFQHFCNVEPHKIVRPSQTRWLSLLIVVNRLLEQWSPLQVYFTQEYENHRLQSSEFIYNSLNDRKVKLFFYFLQWVLPKFVSLNEYFQSERVVITSLYNKVTETYKTLLFSYLNSNYINRNDLADINPRLETEFIYFKNIYLGTDVLDHIDELEETAKKDFYFRCREFLIVSCLEIKKRFDFRDPILSHISIFDPRSENKPNTLFTIIKNLGRIINKDDKNLIQTIDDQWRLYIQYDLPEELKNEKNIDEYWFKISTLCDLAGNLKFPELGNFVLSLLAMPHSNATCERVFSKINSIKTKLRNKLCSETIDGLVLASTYSQNCYSFNIDDKALKLMTSQNLYPLSKSERTAEPASDDDEMIFESEICDL